MFSLNYNKADTKKIKKSIPDPGKVELLLYGSPDLNLTQNSSIINGSIDYSIKSKNVSR